MIFICRTRKLLFVDGELSSYLFQVEEFEITDYDGQNWESFYATSNIKDESKVDTYCRSVKALSFSLDISNTVDFKQ